MANTKISALTAITGANIATTDLIDIVDVSDVTMGVSGTNKKTTFADLSARTETMTNKTLTAPVINSPTGLVKNDVGLGSVDNTSDASKNAAVATLTNKTLTAPVINSPTGLVKADVGLGNVDNTSDATKNAAVATLTNKTLTSPAINSPTGIVKGDVGLGNVDNTSDATKNAASVTLTNKTIALGSNSISGTKAQFDSAVSDGNPVFEGDNVTDLNMATARILGRSTASAGAVEEITIGAGLTLVAGVLSNTAGISDKSVRVYQTGASTTGSSPAWNACAFGAEDFDTDTMHDISVNNTRITITTTGKYCVGGVVSVPSNTSLAVRIKLNGTTVIARQVQGNSNLTEGASLSTIYSFTAGDYIELEAQATGFATSGNSDTNFWAYKIN